MDFSGYGKRGFTLMELLTSVVIILILLALLFPVLSRFRQSGVQVRSMSNMRQMLIAFTMYVDDNDGQMPSEGMGRGGLNIEQPDAWFNVLPPYVDEPSLAHRIVQQRQALRPGDHSIFMCPALKMSDLLKQPRNDRTPIFPFGYNLWIDHTNRAGDNGGHTGYSSGRLHWRDIKSFATRFVIFGTAGPSASNPSASLFDNMAAMHIHYRHMGGRNTILGFADGHVASYRKEEVFVDVSEGKGVNRGGPIWNPDGEH